MAQARRRRAQQTPTTIGELLKQTAPGKAAANVVLSRATWLEVAGVAFAKRTRPDRVERGTLHVIVISPGWAQELTLHAPVLLERLRAKGVEVERLRFRVGDVEPPERGGVHAPAKEEIARARNADAPPEAKAPLARVEGPELRAAIAKTAVTIARRDLEADAIDRASRRRKPHVPGKKS
jgi:hypothetical protein